MQTTFFKFEDGVFSAKLNNVFVEIQKTQLGEMVGKIVTGLVQETFNAEKIADIESNSEHPDFSAYWSLVNEKHSLVHDDLTTLERATQ
jgi:hypothetical protein